MNPTIFHPATDFRKPARTLFMYRATRESRGALGGLLLLLLCLYPIDLSAAHFTQPKPMAKVYHYYGVQKMTGTLQLLASSSDPNFFGKIYSKGEAATELFNAFAIVYRCPSKLTAANLIWRDDHCQPGIRWNQHVEVPAAPVPDRQWQSVPMPGTISNMFNATNTQALFSEPVSGGASTVLTDTQPPVIGGFAIDCGNITNFPTHVLFSAARAGGGWWHDPESGQNAGQIFDVQFPVQSNSFYTAWSSNNLTDWMEYPTPINLHPSRINATSGMYFPILTNRNRFFTLRSYDGGTRTTWQ